MPKATLTHLLQLGFVASQFGGAADWSTASTGYLALILTDAGLWAEGEIGAAPYAAVSAGTRAFACIKKAELMWSSAELWTRRASFVDGNASVGLREGQYLERREYLAHADAAMAAARQAIADAQSALGQTPDIVGSAISVGCVEHGHFPLVTA